MSKYAVIEIVVKQSDLPKEGKHTKSFLSNLGKVNRRIDLRENLIGGTPSLILDNQTTKKWLKVQ